jgi:hypothetical protein
MAVDLVLLLIKQKTCSNALLYCWAKEQNLSLFIFFKLFIYVCLLIIYKNNKKREENKKSLQIKYI